MPNGTIPQTFGLVSEPETPRLAGVDSSDDHVTIVKRSGLCGRKAAVWGESSDQSSLLLDFPRRCAGIGFSGARPSVLRVNAASILFLGHVPR